MPVKAVEMVRNIRDKHYAETKDLSTEEQLEYIRRKAEKLSRDFQGSQHSTADKARERTVS